jgi:hypothetical protein
MGRRLVETELGFPVASADSAASGFTPGFASLLTGEDGSKQFVKAASRKAQRLFADAAESALATGKPSSVSTRRRPIGGSSNQSSRWAVLPRGMLSTAAGPRGFSCGPIVYGQRTVAYPISMYLP